MRALAVSSCAALGLWLAPASAESQTRATQIGPAVFGGTGTRADRPGGLDLSAELFTSYDDDVIADQNGSGPDQETRAGSADRFYTGVSLGLQYARVGRKADFRSWIASTVNYYPDLDDLTTTYHQVGTTFAGRFGRRFTMHVSPFAAYYPRYSLRLFPGSLPVDPGPYGAIESADPVPPDVDSTIFDRQSFRYGGNAELQMLVARHSNLRIGYGYEETTTSGDRTGDFAVQSIGVNFSHELTSSASLRMGYSVQDSTYEASGEPATQIQNVNIGVNYRKPLSRSRRTFLRLNTGTVIADQVDGHRIEATGSAALIHQMGRTWSAQAQYRREVGYLEGFVRPIFSDSATSSVSGLITRRLDLALRASYVTGTGGLRRGAPGFDSYSASARVRRALTRNLAAYAEYLFYHYAFDEAAVRPEGLPRKFNRNGVRVGLSLWLPLTD